ncbi:MAG: hypothetical protein ABIN01_08355 [Ferruginibacter sp.]
MPTAYLPKADAFAVIRKHRYAHSANRRKWQKTKWGPSIALGSQDVKGNCADLIAAGIVIIHTINIAIPVAPASTAIFFASPNLENKIF